VKEGIAKMTKVETALWSRNLHLSPTNHRYQYGLEFGRTFSPRGDVFVSIDKKYPKAQSLVEEVLNKGYWIHEPADWRKLVVKFSGRDPEWLIEPTAQSSVNIGYLVTEHPLVLSVSGSHTLILSATAPADSTRSAEILLTGKGETSLSVRMGESGRYRVALDGVACERNKACKVARSGGDIRVQFDADAEHRLSIQAEPDVGATLIATPVSTK
jgi:hypothetical protein